MCGTLKKIAAGLAAALLFYSIYSAFFIILKLVLLVLAVLNEE